MILPSPIVSLSGYASLNQEYLAPQDVINATTQNADGSHGLIELHFGAPVPSRSKLAGSGISVTGSDGWLFLEVVKGKDDKGNVYPAVRITTRTVVKDDKGLPTGETEDVLEERSQGVEEELKRFFAAIAGNDDGFGDPFEALKDVAIVQAGLNSNGNPVDLVKLVQQ